MTSYSWRCRKKTPKVVKTENGICAVCNSKKSKFIKVEQAKGLIRNLIGEKVPIISDLPLINNLF